MSTTKTSPSDDVRAMQLRTRRERNFEDIEANLPDAKTPALQHPVAVTGFSRLTNWLSNLSNMTRYGRQVSGDDIVWLMDNTAYRSKDGGWEAEFVAAVFEPDVKVHLTNAVSSIAKMMGLADDAEERDTIEQRLIPFLWDIQTIRVFRLNHHGRVLNMGPTSFNGITSQIMPVRSQEPGRYVTGTAMVSETVKGLLNMRTYYAGPEGWGIISDIDDTVKITNTSDPMSVLRETFVEMPTPVAGMPELYTDIKSYLPLDTPWFYLSSSPYNLYPLLQKFLQQYYPSGTMILRDSSWRSVAGLLSALTMGTEEYKVDRMKKVNSWLPKKKMILIGDSTQSDPEAYGEIYQTFPGWVKMILIRKVTNMDALGINEKNQLKRFEKAFKDVPLDSWHVFEDPKHCSLIVEKLIRQPGN